MLLSILLAWLAVIFAVLSAVKYIVRKKGSKRLKIIFSRTHITFGILLLGTGLLHGLLAGNPSSADLSTMSVAPVFFTWNWGTACFVVAVLLALSYVFRKRFRKTWMPVHRILTVLLLVLIVIHVINVGIRIDNRIAALFKADQKQHQAVVDVTDEPNTPEDTPAVSDNAGTDLSTSTVAPSDDNALDESISPDAAASPAPTESFVVAATASPLFSGAQLQDGTYEGSAEGYSGEITVSVTVSGGQVTSITVLSEDETGKYYSQAAALLDIIVDEQSLEVDAVSGATFSSAGIVNAVADALQDAVIGGDLSVAQFNPTVGGH